MANAEKMDETALLFKAVKSRNIDNVCSALSQEVNINKKDPLSSDRTPLHQAIFFRCNEQILSLLIEVGADVNAKDNLEYTPLHIAAIGKNELVDKNLMLLISAGADVDMKNINGDTALQVGIIYQRSNDWYKFTNAARILIDYGANVNTMNKFGNTPLHQAAANGQEETAKLLLDYEAKIDLRNKAKDTPLHVACKKNNSKLVKLLLCGNADVEAKDAQGETPLIIAVNNGNSEIIALLLDGGADVNVTEKMDAYTPLHLAVVEKNKKVVSLLLEAGADANAVCLNGETPLHLAVDTDDIMLMQMLINARADINCENNVGETPLYFATEKNNQEVINFLLSQGADEEYVNQLILMHHGMFIGRNESRPRPNPYYKMIWKSGKWIPIRNDLKCNRHKKKKIKRNNY